jgi:hypothetical protein
MATGATAVDHLTDLELGLLMRQLPPEDRRRVRRAAWGRTTVDEPRLAALAAEQARLNVRGARSQTITSLLLIGGPISRLASSDPAFGRPWLDGVFLVILVAMLIGSVVMWVFARRAEHHASDEDLVSLKRAVAQDRGDARADGRAELRGQWEQRLRERSSSGDR